ncbi:nuclear transport factor 2 family protein [Streptomyces sp. Amel2xE9]|uniref:nuclear transport factor 2 family protein n=1 Tax=unclassified Streptomyces TaxID=2593676 RepID=UPI0003A194D0|nr:nuclear transport factor 2 family protein [Streptomyces sp. Amel2xE9]
MVQICPLSAVPGACEPERIGIRATRECHANSTEARIERLESRIAIEDLLSGYCHGFDGPDRDLLRTLWTEDAVFDLRLWAPLNGWAATAGSKADQTKI